MILKKKRVNYGDNRKRKKKICRKKKEFNIKIKTKLNYTKKYMFFDVNFRRVFCPIKSRTKVNRFLFYSFVIRLPKCSPPSSQAENHSYRNPRTVFLESPVTEMLEMFFFIKENYFVIFIASGEIIRRPQPRYDFVKVSVCGKRTSIRRASRFVTPPF